MALNEFDEMLEQITISGIEVTVLPDREDLVCPDAVFLNNVFCTLPDGGLVHFPMESPLRRQEKNPDLASVLIEAGFKVQYESDWSDWAEGGQYLEGTGSMVLDHRNKMAFAAYSSRTSPQLFKSWCREFGYEAFGFHSSDPDGLPYYHTNVLMSLGHHTALVAKDAVDHLVYQELKSLLEAGGRKVIPMDSGQIGSFAANVLEATGTDGTYHWIASQSAIDAWTAQQRKLLMQEHKIIAVQLPTIESVGGGSARCMLAENHLERL